MVAHLDTHVVVWLWANEARRTKAIEKTVGSRRPMLSPFVLLELQLLNELGRVKTPVLTIRRELERRLDLFVTETPLGDVVEHARAQSWTRDPLDRLIVAHALADGAILVTADRVMLEHCSAARWH